LRIFTWFEDCPQLSTVNCQRRDLRIETHILHHSRLTGKMPVPQENSLFVEQASCLFIKSLLRMVQHLSRNLHNRVFCPYLRAAWRLLSKKTRFLTTGVSRSKQSTVNRQPSTLFKLQLSAIEFQYLCTRVSSLLW
jgi:hypothetical protein